MLRLIIEIRRALAGARDEQARDPAGGRRDQHQPGEMDGIAVALAAKPADDGADQNGDERSAFDQRVAGWQFFALQMIGQDAVFDRAEQRGDHAEQKHARGTAG